jgi:hypothetical protein
MSITSHVLKNAALIFHLFYLKATLSNFPKFHFGVTMGSWDIDSYIYYLPGCADYNNYIASLEPVLDH